MLLWCLPINADDNGGLEDERITELRESIRRAFPAETYVGRITRYYDNLDDPELDEEKDLFHQARNPHSQQCWYPEPRARFVPAPADNQRSGHGICASAIGEAKITHPIA